MLYKNLRTGYVLRTECHISGAEWVECEGEAKAKPKAGNSVPAPELKPEKVEAEVVAFPESRIKGRKK